MVVEELWTKLRSRLPPHSEGLIGIDSKVEQVKPLGIQPFCEEGMKYMSMKLK